MIGIYYATPIANVNKRRLPIPYLATHLGYENPLILTEQDNYFTIGVDA